MRLSNNVVAGPRAAIWTTALDTGAVIPTIVVSTKLNSGSLNQIRTVVAVKTSNVRYDGNGPVPSVLGSIFSFVIFPLLGVIELVLLLLDTSEASDDEIIDDSISCSLFSFGVVVP